MDRAVELDNLALADRHLFEGAARVAEQQARIVRLAEHGHDTQRAESFLALLQVTLTGWQSHRDAIAASLVAAGVKLT